MNRSSLDSTNRVGVKWRNQIFLLKMFGSKPGLDDEYRRAEGHLAANIFCTLFCNV